MKINIRKIFNPKVLKTLIVLGIISGILLVVAGLTAVGIYFWAAKDLPDFKEITDYDPPLVTTVYARDGSILGYFYKEKRFLIPLRDMSNYVPKAFLAAEDSSFYTHEGIDFASIMRAAIKNIKAGTIVQGGSTITQQVVKLLVLGPEKSFTRKFKEAILAYRLEKHLSKDEILTIYLNQIYLGARAYGVEAAARVYFGKQAWELNLPESALLAGLPQAPTKYNPLENPEAAKKRQIYVLEQMRDLGWISEQEFEQAVAFPLVYKSMADPSWVQGAYYLEEVRRWLLERYDEETILTGGMHVYTSMEFPHQIAAERALRNGLIASSKRRGWHGPLDSIEQDKYVEFLEEEALLPEVLEEGEWFKALIVEVKKDGAQARFGEYTGWIDVSTMAWAREPNPKLAPEEVPDIKDAKKVLKEGDIVWVSIVKEKEKENGPYQLALEQEPEVEGALVSIEPNTGCVLALVGGYDFHRSQFNRATQAKRQPGSAFKPIVYSAAIDNGFTPATMVLDAPIVFEDLQHDTLWKPENYEGVFFGPTLLRTALVKSRNLVTIRVAQKIGIQTIINRAKALGLEAEFPKDLSVSLGSASVTPINLCQAFSAFARGGSYVKPRLILRVTDAWDEELYYSEPEFVEAISPQTAYIMNHLLKQVVQHGTGWRARVLGKPVAGKTGTSNNEQDAWFMGYTPYLLSGVYVGFDQLQPMGKYETGSRAASPIWVEYRQAVEDMYPARDFPQPSGIVVARIDAKTGLLAPPGVEESYFLPFKAGTQPTEMAPQPLHNGQDGSTGSGSGDDLLKQIF